MAGSLGLDWRVEAAYDYVDDLTHEQHAFEYLRRNAGYAKDYRRMVNEAQAGRPDTAEQIAASWGLRFRSRPKPVQPSHLRRLVASSQPPSNPADERSADAC